MPLQSEKQNENEDPSHSHSASVPSASDSYRIKIPINTDLLAFGGALLLRHTKNEIVKVPLTQREEEILVLILQEQQSAAIAERLNISVRTVETHRKNMLRKARTNTTVGLVKFAIRLGLVEHYFYHEPGASVLLRS